MKGGREGGGRREMEGGKREREEFVPSLKASIREKWLG